jgi:hypothetical protein
LWQERVPARLRDIAPRVVRQENGDAWVYEDRAFPLSAIIAAMGREKEDFSASQTTYDEVRRACWDPVERVKDMDAGGILSSLCYPSFPWFTGLTFAEMKDRDLAVACVRALNDWLIEDWCGTAPGRFIPGVSLACASKRSSGAPLGERKPSSSPTTRRAVGFRRSMTRAVTGTRSSRWHRTPGCPCASTSDRRHGRCRKRRRTAR